MLQPLLDALAHHRPDMQQTLAYLFVTAPGPFVGHHQLANTQAVLVAELEQFDGAGKVVGQLHVAGRRNTGLGFCRLDDEPTTDRVVRLFEQFAGFAEGSQGHGVGVVGQTLVEQQQIARPVERNAHLACQQQLAGLTQGMDPAVDGGGIDTVWPFAHQAHDASSVGGMTDTGRRQGAVQADFHPPYVSH
ncbi:hypothetical protein D9M71_535760 [compost metagenome]